MVEFLDEVGMDGFIDPVNIVTVVESNEFPLEREACVNPQLQLEFDEEENEP